MSASAIPPERERYPFEVWLFNRRLTVSAAADLMGVSQGQLSRALRDPAEEGFRPASMRLRRIVKAYTEDAVTLDDWPDLPQAVPARRQAVAEEVRS